ncbi:MAG TPA: DotU family type IV/VI secretion system protein, partial [Thermoanaerobaculia bacterium]|nr:DotU family type IV/VI secretion system protein [Thermoanaerobaculia bacterium]
VRLKARVTAGAWVFGSEETVGLGESAAKESPTAVWRRLSSLLERQALEAGSQGGDFALELYRRAQYAMVALADEVFLHTDWAGRDSWRDHLLETKFFGSHRAGEELFERIEDLLHDRETLFAELGRIYLMVLGLGFQGKFRGRPDADAVIANYRHRLFRFVFNRDPLAVHGNQYVVPQAYAATLDEAVTTELPYIKPWIWAIAASILLWVGGSYGIWYYSTKVLEPVVARIDAMEAHHQKAASDDAPEPPVQPQSQPQSQLQPQEVR